MTTKKTTQFDPTDIRYVPKKTTTLKLRLTNTEITALQMALNHFEARHHGDATEIVRVQAMLRAAISEAHIETEMKKAMAR